MPTPAVNVRREFDISLYDLVEMLRAETSSLPRNPAGFRELMAKVVWSDEQLDVSPREIMIATLLLKKLSARADDLL